MGKIFKISGSFKEDDAWIKPDPIIEGEIYADDKGRFTGHCQETRMLDDGTIEKTTKYLIGEITKNTRTNKNGIAFLKLSNSQDESPIMFILSDKSKPEAGIWCSVDEKGNLSAIPSQAAIEVKRSPYTKDRELSIGLAFSKLDLNIPINESLVFAPDLFKNALNK